MPNHGAIAKALADLAGNPEQDAAARETGHCVLLAGPGSGKTKTLTTAMARALVEDVPDPRGVACITFNNECAAELEARLAALGVADDDRSFVGTVHSFALTQVLLPYARCIPGLLPEGFRVATSAERDAAVQAAYDRLFADDRSNPQERWAFAREKRLRDVDRSLPAWRGRNEELADFIEAYEGNLRCGGLIDFDDMPLVAFRMVKDHGWIRQAIRARFPVLFVDEYQDLGHALHELVLLLCFAGGIRLFAVGDGDQSIYGFNGSNPALLEGLSERPDVRSIRLRFNYRSGAKIIRASLGALGEDRDYRGLDDVPEGELTFWKVRGDLDSQAAAIAATVLPNLLARHPPEEIAILYRAAWLGDKVAQALDARGYPHLRTDNNALVKRNSPAARFVEGCAIWATGGWRKADPPFSRLLRQALALFYGGRAQVAKEQALSLHLIAFLRSSIDSGETAHVWLARLYRDLVLPWRAVSRNPQQDWDACLDLVAKTDPATGKDMPLDTFAGRVEGTGRLNLSTLHSAKGREFDAVILYGMNSGDIPSKRDSASATSLREVRRLFYVGVTRPRKELSIVYQDGKHSPWVSELYQRSQKT